MRWLKSHGFFTLGLSLDQQRFRAVLLKRQEGGARIVHAWQDNLDALNRSAFKQYKIDRVVMALPQAKVFMRDVLWQKSFEEDASAIEEAIFEVFQKGHLPSQYARSGQGSNPNVAPAADNSSALLF